MPVAATRRPGVAGSRTAVLVAAALFLASAGAHAEKADRGKPMSVTSAGQAPDVVDLKKHSAVFTGDVVI
ncbi:MAG: lipopolysaccharide transport periplasmic protein LptA, partial [Burkholderiaceae bacterium]